jgi:sulfur carrier protein
VTNGLVRIKVNGTERALAAGSTVRELVAALSLPAQGVAVAVDHRVIPQSQYAETPLQAGAEVEIVRAVGGG